MTVKSFVAATLVALLSVGGISQLGSFEALAQENVSASAAKPDTAAKKPAKPRGRLPNHYAKVVTGDQRNEIYKLQQSYSLRIDELKAEIAKLEAKMQEEIDAVLSKEQLERIHQLAEEAKARRQAAAAKRAAAKKAEAGQAST